MSESGDIFSRGFWQNWQGIRIFKVRVEKKETVQAEPLCPYKGLTLPCTFGKPQVPGEVRDTGGCCIMRCLVRWVSNFLVDGFQERSRELSATHSPRLTWTSWGVFLSRLWPLTSSLSRFLFWLAGVLPEGHMWFPRHCLSVRVLNLAHRNSFPFSLCSRHVSWMYCSFLGPWLLSVWRASCLRMCSVTPASPHLPITPECLVGADNTQASCHLLLF